MPLRQPAGPLTDAVDARRALVGLADPGRADSLQRFFKTGPGEYGEGDRFHGVRVPEVRRLARSARGLSRTERLRLLRSPWHEERLLALLVMVDAYRRGDTTTRQTIVDDYLANTAFINNWDLVDVSAEHVVGAHLDPERLELLEELARSDLVWERRIAMLATLHWTRRGRPEPALRIAERLLCDAHPLIHKAVGWMLREVGKRDEARLDAFLRAHHRGMPRTALRYAVERLAPARRQAFLRGAV